MHFPSRSLANQCAGRPQKPGLLHGFRVECRGFGALESQRTREPSETSPNPEHKRDCKRMLLCCSLRLWRRCSFSLTIAKRPRPTSQVGLHNSPLAFCSCSSSSIFDTTIHYRFVIREGARASTRTKFNTCSTHKDDNCSDYCDDDDHCYCNADCY